ncbi:MAG: hypothetical protein WC050_02170 [Candidatus Paceibacterota bacterium]
MSSLEAPTGPDGGEFVGGPEIGTSPASVSSGFGDGSVSSFGPDGFTGDVSGNLGTAIQPEAYTDPWQTPWTGAPELPTAAAGLEGGQPLSDGSASQFEPAFTNPISTDGKWANGTEAIPFADYMNAGGNFVAEKGLGTEGGFNTAENLVNGKEPVNFGSGVETQRTPVAAFDTNMATPGPGKYADGLPLDWSQPANQNFHTVEIGDQGRWVYGEDSSVTAEKIAEREQYGEYIANQEKTEAPTWTAESKPVPEFNGAQAAGFAALDNPDITTDAQKSSTEISTPEPKVPETSKEMVDAAQGGVKEASAAAANEKSPAQNSDAVTMRATCYGTLECGDNPKSADSTRDNQGGKLDPRNEKIIAVAEGSQYKNGDTLRVCNGDSCGDFKVRDTCGACAGTNRIDLTYAAAREIGMDINKGNIPVTVSRVESDPFASARPEGSYRDNGALQNGGYALETNVPLPQWRPESAPQLLTYPSTIAVENGGNLADITPDYNSLVPKPEWDPAQFTAQGGQDITDQIQQQVNREGEAAQLADRYAQAERELNAYNNPPIPALPYDVGDIDVTAQINREIAAGVPVPDTTQQTGEQITDQINREIAAGVPVPDTSYEPQMPTQKEMWAEMLKVNGQAIETPSSLAANPTEPVTSEDLPPATPEPVSQARIDELIAYSKGVAADEEAALAQQEREAKLQEVINSDQAAYDEAMKQAAIDEGDRERILNDEKLSLEDRKTRADIETAAYQKDLADAQAAQDALTADRKALADAQTAAYEQSLKDAESKVPVPEAVAVNAQKSVEEANAADQKARDEKLAEVIRTDQAAYDEANKQAVLDNPPKSTLKADEQYLKARQDAADQALAEKIKSANYDIELRNDFINNNAVDVSTDKDNQTTYRFANTEDAEKFNELNANVKNSISEFKTAADAKSSADSELRTYIDQNYTEADNLAAGLQKHLEGQLKTADLEVTKAREALADAKSGDQNAVIDVASGLTQGDLVSAAQARFDAAIAKRDGLEKDVSNLTAGNVTPELKALAEREEGSLAKGMRVTSEFMKEWLDPKTALKNSVDVEKLSPELRAAFEQAQPRASGLVSIAGMWGADILDRSRVALADAGWTSLTIKEEVENYVNPRSALDKAGNAAMLWAEVGAPGAGRVISSITGEAGAFFKADASLATDAGALLKTETGIAADVGRSGTTFDIANSGVRASDAALGERSVWDAVAQRNNIGYYENFTAKASELPAGTALDAAAAGDVTNTGVSALDRTAQFGRDAGTNAEAGLARPAVSAQQELLTGTDGMLRAPTPKDPYANFDAAMGDFRAATANSGEAGTNGLNAAVRNFDEAVAEAKSVAGDVRSTPTAIDNALAKVDSSIAEVKAAAGDMRTSVSGQTGDAFTNAENAARELRAAVEERGAPLAEGKTPTVEPTAPAKTGTPDLGDYVPSYADRIRTAYNDTKKTATDWYEGLFSKPTEPASRPSASTDIGAIETQASKDALGGNIAKVESAPGKVLDSVLSERQAIAEIDAAVARGDSAVTRTGEQITNDIRAASDDVVAPTTPKDSFVVEKIKGWSSDLYDGVANSWKKMSDAIFPEAKASPAPKPEDLIGAKPVEVEGSVGVDYSIAPRTDLRVALQDTFARERAASIPNNSEIAPTSWAQGNKPLSASRPDIPITEQWAKVDSAIAQQRAAAELPTGAAERASTASEGAIPFEKVSVNSSPSSDLQKLVADIDKRAAQEAQLRAAIEVKTPPPAPTDIPTNTFSNANVGDALLAPKSADAAIAPKLEVPPATNRALGESTGFKQASDIELTPKANTATVPRVEIPETAPYQQPVKLQVLDNAPVNGVERVIIDRSSGVVIDAKATAEQVAAIRGAQDATGKSIRVVVSEDTAAVLDRIPLGGDIPKNLEVYPVSNPALGRSVTVAEAKPIQDIISKAAQEPQGYVSSKIQQFKDWWSGKPSIKSDLAPAAPQDAALGEGAPPIVKDFEIPGSKPPTPAIAEEPIASVAAKVEKPFVQETALGEGAPSIVKDFKLAAREGDAIPAVKPVEPAPGVKGATEPPVVKPAVVTERTVADLYTEAGASPTVGKMVSAEESAITKSSSMWDRVSSVKNLCDGRMMICATGGVLGAAYLQANYGPGSTLPGTVPPGGGVKTPAPFASEKVPAAGLKPLVLNDVRSRVGLQPIPTTDTRRTGGGGVADPTAKGAGDNNPSMSKVMSALSPLFQGLGAMLGKALGLGGAAAPSGPCTSDNNTYNQQLQTYQQQQFLYQQQMQQYNYALQLSRQNGSIAPIEPTPPSQPCFKAATTPSPAPTPTTTAKQPVVIITANPSSIAAGKTSFLSWAAVGPDQCAVFDPTDTQIATGTPSGTTTTASLTTTSIFKVTCTGGTGSANGQVTVTVQ